jgi:hypothetical protein
MAVEHRRDHVPDVPPEHCRCLQRQAHPEAKPVVAGAVPTLRTAAVDAALACMPLSLASELRRQRCTWSRLRGAGSTTRG